MSSALIFGSAQRSRYLPSRFSPALAFVRSIRSSPPPVTRRNRFSRGELPATLAETLLARCQSEGAASYRALLAASTLAQPFDPEPLATLLRADAAELTEELERLCERRILRVDGPRFRFRYDLVREVLLASLSPARRRLLRQQPGPPGDQAGSAPVKRAPR